MYQHVQTGELAQLFRERRSMWERFLGKSERDSSLIVVARIENELTVNPKSVITKPN
jgi:hypothetical protein